MDELVEADVEEVDKEVDVGEVPPTGDSVAEQVLLPWATLPAAPRFWVGGPSDQVDGREPAWSLRAQNKAPAIQVEKTPLAEMDKELVCRLQAEEVAVEEAHQGRDAATLEVVI